MNVNAYGFILIKQDKATAAVTIIAEKPITHRITVESQEMLKVTLGHSASLVFVAEIQPGQKPVLVSTEIEGLPDGLELSVISQVNLVLDKAFALARKDAGL